MRRIFAFSIAALSIGTGVAIAQDAQTLADIRQEMVVLNTDIQRLKRELSTTSSPSGSGIGASGALDRLDAIEGTLQRYIARTEELEFRIERVVTDGTNRIGDLEFRLCELEPGCDISALGDTPLLGGGEASVTPSAPQPDQPEIQLAGQEQADFDRAQQAFQQGDYRSAADQFEAFNQTYPGGPLAALADLRRGQALEEIGDVRSGARAYLMAFTADQSGNYAPESLYRLGAALGRLGQTQEACVTLAEVATRFPNAAQPVQDAQAAMSNIGCS